MECILKAHTKTNRHIKRLPFTRQHQPTLKLSFYWFILLFGIKTNNILDLCALARFSNKNTRIRSLLLLPFTRWYRDGLFIAYSFSCEMKGARVNTRKNLQRRARFFSLFVFIAKCVRCDSGKMHCKIPYYYYYCNFHLCVWILDQIEWNEGCKCTPKSILTSQFRLVQNER